MWSRSYCGLSDVGLRSRGPAQEPQVCLTTKLPIRAPWWLYQTARLIISGWKVSGRACKSWSYDSRTKIEDENHFTWNTWLTLMLKEICFSFLRN